jgi:hypothetical protein
MASENPDQLDEIVFSKLEDVLWDLAATWRETKNDELVWKYHLVLNCMIDMGWKSGPSLEDSLPTALMPARYFEHIEKQRKEWAKKLNRNEDMSAQDKADQ